MYKYEKLIEETIRALLTCDLKIIILIKDGKNLYHDGLHT